MYHVEEWMTRLDRACHDETRMFYATYGITQPKKSVIQEAIKVCRNCPVQKECRDYALKNKINNGVWGGQLMAPTQEEIADKNKSVYQLLKEIN